YFNPGIKKQAAETKPNRKSPMEGNSAIKTAVAKQAAAEKKNDPNSSPALTRKTTRPKTASTGDRLKTGSLRRSSTPTKLMLPMVLAIQTWAICRSIKVTGPARRRKAQKIDAQVPRPSTQIAK